MKDAIREYLIPNDMEKRAHWDRAIFVFDTNVLLNLYRYSKKSRVALMDAIVNLKGRLFMPHQVAYEFARRRLQIIYQTSDTKVMKKEIETFLSSIQLTFHLSNDDLEYRKLENYINSWIKKWQQENVLVQNHGEDQILDQLLELFDGCTGTSYPHKDYETHCEDAKKRKEMKLPPGYKDGGKTENQEGDYVIWRQIMDYAKAQKKDIVFVTDDQKEDWWYIVSGKTIGPRPELRKEFYNETEHEINFYAVRGFLQQVGGVSKEIINEIEWIESTIYSSPSKIIPNKYYNLLKKYPKYNSETVYTDFFKILKNCDNETLAKINYELKYVQSPDDFGNLVSSYVQSISQIENDTPHES